MIIIFLLYLLCVFTYLYMGVSTILLDVKKAANRIFFVISVTMSVWAGLNALMIVSPDVKSATDFRMLAVFAWGIFYGLLLHYFIILTKRDRILKNPLSYIVLYLPGVYAIYLYYFYQPNRPDEIVMRDFGWSYMNTAGRGFIWDYYLLIYYLSFMFLSIVFLWTWSRRSSLKREKKQAKIIIITIIIAIALGTVTDFILPMLKMPELPPLAVVVCLIPIGGIRYSMKKYKLMNLNYENLALDILKLIDEGLIIADHKGIITSVNKGALDLLRYESIDQLEGRHIRDIFPENFDISAISEVRNKELCLVKRNGQAIPVLLHSKSVKDPLGDFLGTLVSFQDLSEIMDIQEKLKTAYDDLEDKIQKRTSELSVANLSLKDEVEARADAEERIIKIAYYDTLTKLPNRRLFYDRLDQAIVRASRKNHFIALLYLDIDYFKMVNDILGHTKGDELLIALAERLIKTVRKSDTIARLGGDEFIILLHDIKEIEYVENISVKIMACFKDPFIIDDKEIFATASVGISAFPIDGTDCDTLIKNADLAMYRAKESGRNKVEICNYALKKKIEEDMKMANSLYYAISRNELELYYQPQVNYVQDKIIGLEALLRWNHPELGRVQPKDFIPIAERSGLIVPIGEWVINTACRQNKLWQEQGLPKIPVAVNISVKQFHNAEIVKVIRKILKETCLDPSHLELEITENIVIKDLNHINTVLQELKSLGVRIAIDDFGTEYASLNYLKQLPIDRIKIAQTFIQGLNISSQDESITETIIMLAHKIHLDVVAEGVETREQVNSLRKYSCEKVQGYYFYRPMPRKDVEEILRERSGMTDL